MERIHKREDSALSSKITSNSKDDSDSLGYASSNSTPPPTLADIDRWRYHMEFENFRKRLQDAANIVFPNDTNSRYAKVSVLILSWEDEDPQLPVSQEINQLHGVFRDDYGYETEIWNIPVEHSHWKLTEKVMDFVKPDEEAKTHLKIVYYAGHAKLTETRLLVWTSWRNNKKLKCPMVKWGGIQTILEESISDVLILLDCCASGTANASDGNGVNELISACAFNEIANGVGPYSFTSALVTELRLLSNKPSFSVGELYKKIFFRTQCRMPEERYLDGTQKERHPAPIHLVLSQGESGPRGIQLPTNLGQRKSRRDLDSRSRTPLDFASPIHSQRPTTDGIQSFEDKDSFSSLVDGTSKEPFDENPTVKYSTPSIGSPRLLFSVRLRETFRPDECMTDLFTEWIRNFPTIADHMSVEALFDSHSTLVIMSLPVDISAYMPQDLSIICLGPVTSRNRMISPADRNEVHKFMTEDQVMKSSRAQNIRNFLMQQPVDNSEAAKPSEGHHHYRSISLPDNAEDLHSRDSIQSTSSNSSSLRESGFTSPRSSMNTTYSRSSRTLESLSEAADSMLSRLSKVTSPNSRPQRRPGFDPIHQNTISAVTRLLGTQTSLESRKHSKSIGKANRKNKSEDTKDDFQLKTFTCLLGTCTSTCSFPCFSTHHFQVFQTNHLEILTSHLADVHSNSHIKIPDYWTDTYVHSKDGWSCPRCLEFLGTWPTNHEKFEAHFNRCSHESPGTLLDLELASDSMKHH